MGVRTLQLVLEHLDDISASILIVACIIFLSLGIDSEVKSILTASAGYLFGTRVYTKFKKRG
jgi:hypothetical protein